MEKKRRREEVTYSLAPFDPSPENPGGTTRWMADILVTFIERLPKYLNLDI